MDIGLVRRIFACERRRLSETPEAMMPVRRPAGFSKHGVAKLSPGNAASALVWVRTLRAHF